MTPEEVVHDLHRQIRELQEELSEYRRGPETPLWRTDERAYRIRMALTEGRKGFSNHGWGARLIAFLIDHPGVIMAHERILAHVTNTDGDHERTVHVAVHRARQLLAAKGLRGLECAWGVGYRMTPDCMAAVKALLGEAPQA